MFPLGIYELLIVLAISLLLFGGRLPALFGYLGQGWRAFRGELRGPDGESPRSE